ncbi:MAG: AbrB/MazE/SpoVT family DNA-binding domain-containing protein [Candidatus Omnitrophica bacterium]|nr:AbrB/MazE/SpoVT family DNA-binding domain-containing protein [Candidatus Omnitrophota bacterium]
MQTLLETTRLSSKGQVVLPLAIRRKLHLSNGEKFAVMGEGDTVILKKITAPPLSEIRQLLERSRRYARQVGLKPSDIRRAVQRVHRTSR